MRITAAILLLSLSAVPALAGQAEAENCAAGLDANSQLIFKAVLPQVTPSTDLKGAVTAATKSLVEGGQLTRDNARPAAMAAGKCLKLAMQ